MIASGVVPVLAYLLLVLFLTASWRTRGEGARALTSLKTAKSPARTGRSGTLRPGADLDVVLARLRQVVVGVLAHALKSLRNQMLRIPILEAI